MVTYEWRSWSSAPKSVEADEVTFESEHVVFWRRWNGIESGEPRVLVLAVQNHSIIDLRIKSD